MDQFYKHNLETYGNYG